MQLVAREVSLKSTLTMKQLFARKRDSQDFSQHQGHALISRHQRLMEKCKKYDVSIYIDDLSEQTTGIYAELRPVASEAELERRLNAKNAIRQSNRANAIAAVALAVSLVALVKSFL